MRPSCPTPVPAPATWMPWLFFLLHSVDQGIPISQSGALSLACNYLPLFLPVIFQVCFSIPKTSSLVSETQNAISESSLGQQTGNHVLQHLAQRV